MTTLRSVSLWLLVVALGAWGATLAAQTSPQTDLPTLEPTFTRIFGSDTLAMYAPNMSPDGRWIVFFVHEGGERQNLWIVSAEGGEPTRLTHGDFQDDGARWFPGSDRIAFRSDRQGHWAVMSLSIDPQTGRAIEPSRPVTLEGSQAYLDVSPDGKWIAYTPRENGKRVIRIIPSNGGSARTLVAADTPKPLWGTRGQYIYYHLASGSEWALMRIAVEGGEPDTVMTRPGPPRLGHSFLLLGEGGGSRVSEVMTLSGEVRARFRLPEEMRGPGLTGPDSNNRFLTTVSGFGSALQVVPIAGGPARRLTEGRAEDRPLGWTDDDRILFSTQLNGTEVLLLAPAAGGPMHQVNLPEKRRKLLNTSVPPPFLSRDGAQLVYEVDGDDPDVTVLKVFSVEDGTTEVITSAHWADGAGVTGPGGVPHFDGQEFLYLARDAGVHELRAWTSNEGSHLVRSFGGPPGPIGVHGDRIVYTEYADDWTTLRITTAGEIGSRELARVRGWLQSVSWSPNSRYLTFVHVDTTGGWEAARVALLEVSASGAPIGDLRYVSDASLSWWNLRWLPDGSGVLAARWDDAKAWLLPLDPNDSPVCLTPDEPRFVSGFVLSPDGTHIVYPQRLPRGSSIWLVDLGTIPGGSP
jgi:Tol biopolymer transport system component